MTRPTRTGWFRGVGGEVIGGEYRFNGVAIEAAEEGDVHPALVVGQLRDFPAGPKVAAEAEFTLGGRGFSFLDPAKKTARSIGLVILDRKFSRGTRDAMTIPTLFLTLDESPDGARSVRFAYAGEPRLNPERTVTADAKEWNPAGSYRFSLTLADGTATGTITGADGKVLFKGRSAIRPSAASSPPPVRALRISGWPEPCGASAPTTSIRPSRNRRSPRFRCRPPGL